jgi:hypothetical protein
VFAIDRPVQRSVLVRRTSNVRGRLRTLRPLFDRDLVRARRDGQLLTDDRAPVEWLTDRMLLEQIARGGGLDEMELPTWP